MTGTGSPQSLQSQLKGDMKERGGEKAHVIQNKNKINKN